MTTPNPHDPQWLAEQLKLCEAANGKPGDHLLYLQAAETHYPAVLKALQQALKDLEASNAFARVLASEQSEEPTP